MTIKEIYLSLRKKLENYCEEKTEFTFWEFIKYIFTNKDKLAILTLIIYFVGIIFQFLKITNGGDLLKNDMLTFFSFTNSLNDFIAILLYALGLFCVITFLAIIFIGILRLFKNKLGIKGFLIYSFLILLGFGFFGFFTIEGSVKFKSIVVFLILFILFLSLIISYIICYYLKTKLIIYYGIFAVFFSYSFIVLNTGKSFYACYEKNIKNEDLNDNSKCIKFNYKNDKYGFTGSGSVYKLDEFKSFYTDTYINNKKN